MPPFVLWVSRLLPTNPIVVRLVHGGSRRLRHLYIRSGYLAIMMLILLFALLGDATTMKQLAQRGASAFTVISFGQVGLLCLLTPVFMAGAIAQEASPRTWDILLTTPLSNLQIVLGTLFGRLFFVLALLLSTLPLFATTQFFGGVPGDSIFLSYAIAACSALLVAAIAVTLSVTRSAGKRAVFVFYITVVMYLFVTYAIDLALRWNQPVSAGTIGAYYTTWLTAANPFLAIESLLMANTYVVPDVTADGGGWIARVWVGRPVGGFCWACSLLSIVMIGYSTLRLRVIGTRGATIAWHKRLFGNISSTGERKLRVVGHNPIAWRERTSRSDSFLGRMGRWLFVLAGAAAALVVISLFHSAIISPSTFQLALITIVVAEIVIVGLTAISLSGVAVSREREDGTLDLLLTTPIQPGPYIAGKLQGLVQFLLPMILVPFVSMGLASLYVLIGFGNKNLFTTVMVGTVPTRVPILLPEGALLVPIVLIAFISLCVMIGLGWSIKSKGTIGSVFAATGVALVVGGVLGLCATATGGNVPLLGAVLNALIPVNLALASIKPESVMSASLDDLPSARVSLIIGTVIAALAYVGIVFALHANMKRTFMMTVRRLAGTN